MTQYLLSIYQPGLEGEAPPTEVLETIMRDIEAVDRKMREAEVWVFTAGLYPPIPRQC